MHVSSKWSVTKQQRGAEHEKGEERDANGELGEWVEKMYKPCREKERSGKATTLHGCLREAFSTPLAIHSHVAFRAGMIATPLCLQEVHKKVLEKGLPPNAHPGIPGIQVERGG
jgi:hypothetical protein